MSQGFDCTKMYTHTHTHTHTFKASRKQDIDLLIMIAVKILPLFCAIFIIESTLHKYTTNPCSTQEQPIPERCIVPPVQNTGSTKLVMPLRCNCCHVRSLTKSIPVLSSTKQTYLPPSSLSGLQVCPAFTLFR